MQCEEKDIPAFGLMGMLMHKMMNRAKGMYQEFDLNKSQAGILFTLHRSDSMSQKELAARLNVTPPSITSSIQKMERDAASRSGRSADNAADTDGKRKILY